MKFLIVGDAFTGLHNWLFKGGEPKGMPGVYNFYQYLGKSKEHSFVSFILNKTKDHKIYFDNGSVIYLIKIPFSNHMLFRVFSIPIAIFHITKCLKRENFDVLYGMANYSIATGLVSRVTSIPNVSRQFGSLIPDLIKKEMFFKIYTRFVFDYLACLLSKDLLISTNDGTEYHLLAKKCKKESIFHYFYNGIDLKYKDHLESLPESISTSSINISYIGRLSFWKRQDLALSVVSILVHKYGWDNIKLRFLGDGPDHDQMIEQVKAENITHNVEFLGSRDRDGVLEVLGDTDIALFLYDNSCLGNALWEAMFAGRCIVARDSGDTKSVLDGSALIVTSDPEDVAFKIDALLRQENGISNYGSLARNTANKLIHSWDERFEKELSLISDMTN